MSSMYITYIRQVYIFHSLGYTGIWTYSISRFMIIQFGKVKIEQRPYNRSYPHIYVFSLKKYHSYIAARITPY